MKTIVGIDPGFTNLGIAILNADTGTVLDAYVVTTKRETKVRMLATASDNLRRTTELSEAIFAVLAKYKPVMVAMEAPSMSGNASTSMVLGMCFGAIVGACYSMQIPYAEIPPRDLKKFLTGDSTSDKAAMLKSLQVRCPTIVRIMAGHKTAKARYEHAVDAAAACYHAYDNAAWQLTLIKRTDDVGENQIPPA